MVWENLLDLKPQYLPDLFSLAVIQLRYAVYTKYGVTVFGKQ